MIFLLIVLKFIFHNKKYKLILEINAFNLCWSCVVKVISAKLWTKIESNNLDIRARKIFI